ERSVIDATLLAIEEVNERGGVLGCKIEPVVVDGKSDWPTFAAEAERLITVEKVSAVFGCWTSASRKTVKPVFEKHNHLLFYPVQYEGLEQSPNIVYTGAAPNQQIIPAVEWCWRELKAKKFFLVGSDYVFPRAAHAIIRGQVEKLGGQIVGDEYVLLGSADFKAVVTKIQAAKPDVILNSVNGDSNIALFEQLRAAGITSASQPTLSFSIAEDELRSMGGGKMMGDYCAWNYFQSLDTKENQEFVARFKAKYGRNRVTDDPMEAAYIGVHLWARAVAQAGTVEPSAVRKALANLSFTAPQGLVKVDPATQHIHRTARVGRIGAEGQFIVVWASPAPVPPEPFPAFKSKSEWESFLADLYNGWDQRWANPGK
ncbi:MAG: urea ABC transporter substrate-binding protein, partial [Verrucomicrobia bacterium]|nr:urea ABC transporter substrate-binding protein [Verrucomicrobiota bacterium]